MILMLSSSGLKDRFIINESFILVIVDKERNSFQEESSLE